MTSHDGPCQCSEARLVVDCACRCHWPVRMSHPRPVPKRIQRKRTKGWRMPAGAVYVGRPSRWGNLVRVGDCGWCAFDAGHDGPHQPWTPAEAVSVFAAWASSQPRRDFLPLRGRDLACWCPLDQPCHADVLLELAAAG